MGLPPTRVKPSVTTHQLLLTAKAAATILILTSAQLQTGDLLSICYSPPIPDPQPLSTEESQPRRSIPSPRVPSLCLPSEPLDGAPDRSVAFPAGPSVLLACKDHPMKDSFERKSPSGDNRRMVREARRPLLMRPRAPSGDQLVSRRSWRGRLNRRKAKEKLVLRL